MALSITSLPLVWFGKTRLNPNHGHSSQTHQPTPNILCLAINQILEPPIVHRADYWDNDYIKSLTSQDTEDDMNKTRVEELKKSVRGLLDKSVDPLAKLDTVDAITRLGVGYHFKDEIKSVLVDVVEVCSSDHDLYSTALLFRLLRQHGHNVSSDMFSRFKDESGDFKACLGEDVKGMLSLYEASYLGIEDEVLMDEAKAFARKHLKETNGNITPTLAKKVAHSMELPYARRVSRAEARWYIDIYESEENMKPSLFELAKLDYNMVQATYRQEFGNVVRWWEDLGLEELGFVRGKMMISFIWSLGMASEPQLGHLREEMSKLCILLTVLDDMYDTCESMDELKLFTASIERWDVSAMEQLPQYMKLVYMALLNTTNIIGYQILKTQGYDITQHQKKAWLKLCNAYLVEANCYKQGHTPTSKEYFESAVYSIGMHMGLLNCYFFTADKITREALGCIESFPSLVYCPSLMLRLANDLGTFTDKDKKGSIQVYMHEKGVSEEVAKEHVRETISNLWQKMNRALVSQHPFSDTFAMASLSLCQLSQCISMLEDGGVDSNISFDNLMSLVFEPISLN